MSGRVHILQTKGNKYFTLRQLFIILLNTLLVKYLKLIKVNHELRYKCLVCGRKIFQKRARHNCNGVYINPGKWRMFMTNQTRIYFIG